MRICVCFKIIPDYDQVTYESWKSGLSLPNFRYVKKNFGVFDEGALETALCLKDACPQVFLEAVSFGRNDSIFTEALYAAGYDAVTYLKNPGSEFDCENTAAVLSEYINGSDADIILCGEQAGPADSGTVPYLIAGKLGIPVIDKISSLEYIDGKVLLKRQTADFSEGYWFEGRLLAVVSSAEKPYLRWADFSRKQAAEKMKAETRIIVTKPRFCVSIFSKPEHVCSDTVFLESSADLDRLLREAQM